MGYRVIDVSQYIDNLGDQTHGLKAAKVITLPDGDGVLDRIIKASAGPTEFSTSTTLVCASDQPIFDVNRYYRDLGIAWPYKDVSRRDLQRAYNRLGGENAPNAARLAYCMSQLLNPECRKHYDAMPLGSLMDDRYTQEMTKRAVIDWAVQQTMATGIFHDPQDVVDEVVAAREAAKAQEERTKQYVVRSNWPYAYYLWRSRRADVDTLSEWQDMIVRACSALGLSPRISLGYVGATDAAWTKSVHNSTLVIFLNERIDPTPDLAHEIAQSFTNPLTYWTATTPTREVPTMTTATENTKAAVPDDDDDDDFLRGGSDAQARQEAETAARKAARGQQEFLSSLMKESGDTIIIRWITDENQLIEVNQHYVPTKAAPADKPAEMKWPAKMSAVCRHTPRRSGKPWFDDCYICDHMRDNKGEEYSRGTRMWGLAVVRKRVLGTEEMAAENKIRPEQVGSPIGMTDDLIEVDEIVDKKLTGNKVYRKHYVVANFGLKNFFSQFIQFARPEVYGTLLDRDYLITRVGKDTDTEYRAAPLDVINKKDEDGAIVPFDLRNPKFAALYEDHGIDLAKTVKRMMSDEYYGRFFDPRVTVSWKTKGSDEDTSAPATQAAADTDASGPTQDKLKAMREKIRQENQGSTPAPSAPAEGAPTGMLDLS